MSKVVPYKHYTRAELKELIDGSTAAELALQGYAIRHNVLTGTIQVVPWHEAAIRREDGSDRKQTVQRGPDFGVLPPIVKRSPEQRVDALMARWINGMKAAGGLPALNPKNDVERKALDDKIKEIVGAAWVEGRTEITADVVRQVAASFLRKAEAQHEAKLDKQITRHED